MGPIFSFLALWANSNLTGRKELLRMEAKLNIIKAGNRDSKL
jgi:hypothetical protein